MYVLDPYETATIRGWRTSLSEVRRFVFVDEKRSYAERTNQANGDMGWIRVLAFREQRPLAWTLPKFKDDSRRNRGESKDEEYGYDGDAPNDARRDAAPAPSIGKEGARQYHGAPEAQESVPGTGWGDRSHDPVRQTQFLAAASPTDRITLRYEYASGLRALGILPVRNRIWERERGDLGFAKPPRW
jgi:hypothetical protein